MEQGEALRAQWEVNMARLAQRWASHSVRERVAKEGSGEVVLRELEGVLWGYTDRIWVMTASVVFPEKGDLPGWSGGKVAEMIDGLLEGDKGGEEAITRLRPHTTTTEEGKEWMRTMMLPFRRAVLSETVLRVMDAVLGTSTTDVGCTSMEISHMKQHAPNPHPIILALCTGQSVPPTSTLAKYANACVAFSANPKAAVRGVLEECSAKGLVFADLALGCLNRDEQRLRCVMGGSLPYLLGAHVLGVVLEGVGEHREALRWHQECEEGEGVWCPINEECFPFWNHSRDACLQQSAAAQKRLISALQHTRNRQKLKRDIIASAPLRTYTALLLGIAVLAIALFLFPEPDP